jgi:hypothetical protein
MGMKRKIAAALLALAAASAPLCQAFAAQEDSSAILDKVISAADPKAYRVDGIQGKPTVRAANSPNFPRALRVDVPGKAPNAWAIAVSVPVNKPVKAGDKLVLAVWARLEKGENGATSTILPYNAVQMSASPYTALFSGPLTIDSEWKLQQVEGSSNADHAAGTLNVSIHLATAKQVVDIGPVFLLDMGQ